MKKKISLLFGLTIILNILLVLGLGSYSSVKAKMEPKCLGEAVDNKRPETQGSCECGGELKAKYICDETGSNCSATLCDN